MTNTFASLIHACEHLGICEHADSLRRAGFKSVDEIKARSLSALSEHLDKQTAKRLWQHLHPLSHTQSSALRLPGYPEDGKTTTAAAAPRRSDFQAAPVRTGTSRKRALAAASSEQKSQARANFIRDQYAPLSLPPRQAWWDTWCRFARAWQMQPLPLTVRLVEAVGTSLKEGKYSSAPNYFSRACQEHERTTGLPVPADVRRAIKDALRSIARGLGAAPLRKLSPWRTWRQCPPPCS